MSFQRIEVIKSMNNYVTGKPDVIAFFEADTVADLPAQSQTEYTVCMGSKCHVIETNSVYMINSSGVWYVQEVGTDVYTKSETDALFLTKQDAYGINEQNEIHLQDDLDDFTIEGSFYCPNATTAQSLTNCPTQLPFRLEVTTLNGSARYIQKIIDGNPSNSTPHVFYRVKTAAGFGAWYQVGLTAV